MAGVYREGAATNQVPQSGYSSSVTPEFDEIGIWSEVKLAIIRDYASAYAKILDATRRDKISKLRFQYIDAYAGPGVHLSKTTGQFVEGSPLIALNTNSPFSQYHFVDADPARAAQLRAIAGGREDVHIYSRDCNDVLLREVFPKVRYSDYQRGLCLLDPYNINLRWEVIETAGHMGSIEVFLNFMIMDINRNALRRNPSLAVQSKVEQLTRLWGDDSWVDAAYSNEGRLFDDPQKVSNAKFEEAFRERLKKKAGFKYVSPPMPMRTKTNSVIYYLYFASQKPVASGIVDHIFNAHRKQQGL